MLISIDAVIVGAGRRKTTKRFVAKLADSIKVIGLQTPISVLPADETGRHPLVAGRNRLEAFRHLGLREIEANVISDKISAELWEIAENLWRDDLTVMQRTIAIGRWVKLTAKKIKLDQKDKVRHGGAKPRQRGVGQGVGGGRPGGGVRAAARELGVSETTARRSVNVANHLSVQARKEAAKLGLDNSLRALDAAASMPADYQVAILRDYAEDKKQERKKRAELAATQEQIARVLAGTEPPTDAEGAFQHWYWRLDTAMQRNVRGWLRTRDVVALADELEELSVASAVH